MPNLMCFAGARRLVAPLMTLAAALAALPAAAEPDAAQSGVVSCVGVTSGMAGLKPKTDSKCTFTSGQWKGRFYIIYVPTSFTSSKPALVIDLHGYGLDATWQETYSGQETESEAVGFVAVWPQGTAFGEGMGVQVNNDDGRSWNAGIWTYTDSNGATENKCCGAAAGYDKQGNYDSTKAVDDVAFLTAVIRDAKRQIANTFPAYAVEKNKVFPTAAR